MSHVAPYISESDLMSISACQAPADPALLRQLAKGIDFLTDFLKSQYLEDYIAAGGSKIKFITGRKGTGKSFLGRLVLDDAAQAGYLTVHLSARQVWLHDFREIYLEILRQCDIRQILLGCAEQIITDMGYDPAAVPEGLTFMDHQSDQGKADGLVRSEIRGALREKFLQNPRLDNNFAMCCSLLTGDILGHPALEAKDREMLLGFLENDRSVKLSQLRSIGLAPARVSRYNARHMLRSLCEVVHLSGRPGICVLIDDVDVLLVKSSSEPIHYTRMRRDDTYESIRQLIDDIDSMHHILFLFAFNRELIEDVGYGIKSYSALWMRIQSEVTGLRFNRFADILDLDRLSDQIYTPESLVRMSGKLASVLGRIPAAQAQSPAHLVPLDLQAAEALIERSEYGGLGLPYLVCYALLHPEASAGYAG